MLHNSLSHITTQTKISFPVLPRRHEQRRSYRLPERSAVAAAARSAPSVVVNNTKTKGEGKGMSWFYEMEQEVREYELDQFGVVNNAVYSNYCEYGTFKLLDKIGFDADLRLAVSEITAKYISPLKRKDRFVLKLRLYDYSTTRLYFEDQIVKLPNRELILSGTSTLVLLDEKLRPSRLTPSMISKFNQFLLTHANNIVSICSE